MIFFLMGSFGLAIAWWIGRALVQQLSQYSATHPTWSGPVRPQWTCSHGHSNYVDGTRVDPEAFGQPPSVHALVQCPICHEWQWRIKTVNGA